MKRINLLDCGALRQGVAALLLFAVSIATNAYDFSAVNDDGVTIYYNITSDTEVEVTYGGSYNTAGTDSYNRIVVIPETVEYSETTYTVTTISRFAFNSCTGLISVTIPNSVTEIGIWAFAYSSDLTSITIPDGVTTIGNDAFYGCTGLTEVTIGNSVTEIDMYTFCDCTGLTSVTIGSSVTTIGLYAFYGCTGLIQFEVAEDNAYYCSVDGVLYSKDIKTLVQFPLASPLLPSFDIPDGVTSIGRDAFRSCTGLTSVTIPESVTEIGSEAFEACTGLTEVTIGNSVTAIGNCAFNGCTGLTSVIIPNSAEAIGDYAFYGCTGLTQVNFGNSLTKIGDYAFRYCSSLTQVTIPNSVISIGYGAFCECSGLAEVNFNATTCTSAAMLDNYGWGIFSNGDNLSKFNFGDNVTIIPGYLCSGLRGLTEITIPNSVTEIGENAFYGCTGLTQFEVAEGNECFCAVDGVLYSKDMTTLVLFPLASLLLPSFDIPNGVTTISSSAFYRCTGLTEVTIPNSATSIGSQAFWYCTGLTSVTIGESVTMIGQSAFNCCTGLTSMTSLNPEPPTCRSYVFGGVTTSTCVLYVPEGSLKAYSTADQWKNFLNIIDNQPNAIDDILTSGSVEAADYYTLDGKMIAAPQRGINIVRYSDGSAKKVLVK